jgi:hypothetical protein
MIATSTTTRQSTTLDTVSTDLVLRICGSQHHGQVVRLKSTKCTIGSGLHCTLRLKAPGIAPLHCLVLRGVGGAIVRCWSPDTRWNHRAFTDAALSPGDRLSIGPVDLEVVSTGVMTPVDSSVLESTPDTAIDFDRESQERDLQEQSLEEERQRLEKEWERLRASSADLQEREALSAGRAEQLDLRWNEAESRRQILDQEHRQWQTEQEEAHRRLQSQQEELAAGLADFETHRHALAEERRVAAVELEAKQAELEAKRNAWLEERRRWDAIHGENVTQIASR